MRERKANELIADYISNHVHEIAYNKGVCVYAFYAEATTDYDEDWIITTDGDFWNADYTLITTWFNCEDEPPCVEVREEDYKDYLDSKAFDEWYDRQRM